MENMTLVEFEAYAENYLKTDEKEKMRRERMLSAVRGKISLAATKHNVEISESMLDKLMSIIDIPEVHNIGVVCHRVDKHETLVENDLVVEYKIEKSNVTWGYEHVFFLWFVSKNKLKEKQLERLEKYILNKSLPLGDEIIQRVNPMENVEFHIFQKAAEFVIAVKEIMADGGEFIGQKVYYGDKIKFVPNKPLGYVKGNDVYLSVPSWQYLRTDWKFLNYK